MKKRMSDFALEIVLEKSLVGVKYANIKKRHYFWQFFSKRIDPYSAKS